MEISIDLEIPMGHRLLNYPGRCAHLHGHNYQITVSIEGNPNHLGLVVDYGELKDKVRHLLDQFDHSMILCDLDSMSKMPGRVVLINHNPSAENLASLWFNLLQDNAIRPKEVRVRETSKTEAIARGVDRNVRITEVRT